MALTPYEVALLNRLAEGPEGLLDAEDVVFAVGLIQRLSRPIADELARLPPDRPLPLYMLEPQEKVRALTGFLWSVLQPGLESRPDESPEVDLARALADYISSTWPRP